MNLIKTLPRTGKHHLNTRTKKSVSPPWSRKQVSFEWCRLIYPGTVWVIAYKCNLHGGNRIRPLEYLLRYCWGFHELVGVFVGAIFGVKIVSRSALDLNFWLPYNRALVMHWQTGSNHGSA